METGWDPEVTKYFKKILNSISVGLLWLLTMATSGIYFGLAYFDGKPIIQNIIFYLIMAVSLGFLIYYFYRTWKK